jgi:hypothetical protein
VEESIKQIQDNQKTNFKLSFNIKFFKFLIYSQVSDEDISINKNFAALSIQMHQFSSMVKLERNADILIKAGIYRLFI